MGGALGDELSDVRVHVDETAAALSQAVSARAFAMGRDVYFDRDEYRPGSSDGDRLLAHELAHVVQQRGASGGGDLRVSEPGDPLEREAEAAATTVARSPAAAPARSLARAPKVPAPVPKPSPAPVPLPPSPRDPIKKPPDV
jgi:hypothetical protein